MNTAWLVLVVAYAIAAVAARTVVAVIRGQLLPPAAAATGHAPPVSPGEVSSSA